MAKIITSTTAMMLLDMLEPRVLLAASTVDLGPQWQAQLPDSVMMTAPSSSSTSVSSLINLSPSNPAVTAVVSGSPLAWTDYSARYNVSNPQNFMLRDGVNRAGNITLSFSNLNPGTYTLTLYSADYSRTGTSAVGQFNVNVTDLTRNNVTVLSGRRTVSRDQLSQAAIQSFTFSPRTDKTATINLARTSGTIWLNGFTISDGINHDASAPVLATVPWSAAPYPVKAGVAGVTMVANPATDASGVQYYFENTSDPSRNSGWIDTPSWSDLGLDANTTYSYRYQTRDKSSLQNVSAWTPAAQVTTFADNQFAGFTDAEIGPRQPVFDFTGVRTMPAAPAPGVHPRIFTTAQERDEIRNRLATTTAGQEVTALIAAYTRILTEGSAAYSSSANYALDPWGFARINNVGYYDSSVLYNNLVNYTTGQPNPLPFKADGTYDGDPRNRLASQMAIAAYEAWLNEGRPEYDARALNLAKAVTNLAALGMQDPEFGPNDYNTVGGVHLALCYDFLYNIMTPQQRDTVRAAIVGATWTEAQNYGEDVAYYATTSNWTTLNNFVPIMLMAVEGEPGNNDAYLRTIMRTQYNFLTYGWYDSGAGNEGLGKNYQNLSTLASFSRRGYHLAGHPHVRAFVTDYIPSITQPYGYAFSEYDDWGGSGRNQVTGDYKFAAEDAVGAKWLFPNDPTADFVLQNYMGQTGNSNPYAAYMVQNTIGQKPFAPHGYLNNVLLASLQAMDFNTANLSGSAFTSAAAAANDNQLTSFEHNRGLVNTRSDFSQNALSINFSSRQDLGGHTHADRNNFNLSALGRMWAIYRSESSATDVGRGTLSEAQFHSMVFVDGRAQAINNERVAKQPGKIVSVIDTQAATFASGDAKYAYDWKWNGHLGAGIPIGPSTLPVTESLNDFRMNKSTEPWYEEQLYNRPFWNGGGDYENFTKESFNPMRTAYRTTGVVRGSRPYALIIDDYQKDDVVRNYKWYLQIADDLTIESTTVDTANLSNYRNDIVLKEATGNRRLLVRVIQNNGAANPSQPVSIDSYLDPRYGTSTWKRLLIESNSANPQFKVMLFPFTTGQSLPVTSIAPGSFTNTLDGRTDVISHSVGADGRTRLSLSQNGVVTAAEAPDVAPGSPLNISARPISQSRVLLSWTPADTREQVFLIERSTDGVNFTTLNTVLNGVTEYLDFGLPANTQYTYRVTALNSLASAPSTTASTRTWSAGSVRIQTGSTTYSQNFDHLISSVVNNTNWGGDNWLPGWHMARNDTPQFRFTSGTETFPRPFSLGSANDTSGTNLMVDRAMGGLPATNGYHSQGVQFINASGFDLSRIDISYFAEQWRQNVNAGTLKFYYKVTPNAEIFNLTTVSPGWTELPALAFSAKTGTASSLDGNAPANRQAMNTQLPIAVPNGQYLWLGWQFLGGPNTSSAMLAVDDLNVTFQAAPRFVQPATALPSVITGSTSTLASLADDLRGEAALIYDWSSSGPSAVTFSVDATNAAKSTVATFSKAGQYTLTAKAMNAAGLFSASTVPVNVVQTATSFSAGSPVKNVTARKSVQLFASIQDQFNDPMLSQPQYTWSIVSGGGSVSSTGLFTPPAFGSGPFVIQVQAVGQPQYSALITLNARSDQPFSKVLIPSSTFSIKQSKLSLPSVTATLRSAPPSTPTSPTIQTDTPDNLRATQSIFSSTKLF